MRYLTNEHPSARGVWVICDDGFIIARYGDSLAHRDRAVDALVSQYDQVHWSLVAAATPDDSGMTPWESDPGIAYVGVETSDKRVLEPGGGSFRAFPQPLMAQIETSWGHNGAVIAGRIDQASIDGENVRASGMLDSGQYGQDIARLVDQQMLHGISVDLGYAEVTTEILAEDEDGWPIDWLDRFIEWEIAGATITPWPAFSDARVKLTAAESTDDDAVAASISVPDDIPTEWFENPQLTEPTPHTVSDDGRVYGHLATWGTCHIGRQGACVTPPKSKTDYSYFTTGVIKCAEGCEIPVGPLTMGTGHADIKYGADTARSHYDNTGTVFADVAIGEDSHGIWYAGALRNGLTDDQVREARASAPSGDWRRLDGNLELVAVLNVNTPGYPLPRARTASGEPQALVAAGVLHTDVEEELETATMAQRVNTLEKELSTMRRAFTPLLSDAVSRLSTGM